MSGLNFTVESETFGGGDKSWLRTRMGLTDMLPIMLDISTFATGHVVNGYIPSGTALGLVTGNGMYGPYVQGAGGDGRETLRGHLFEDAKVSGGATALATAPDVGVALFWTGVVKEANLPTFAGTTDGEVDAAAKTEVASWIRYV